MAKGKALKLDVIVTTIFIHFFKDIIGDDYFSTSSKFHQVKKFSYLVVMQGLIVLLFKVSNEEKLGN